MTDTFRGEIDSLGCAELYAIKIETRGTNDTSASEWAEITPDQLALIVEISRGTKEERKRSTTPLQEINDAPDKWM